MLKLTLSVCSFVTHQEASNMHDKKDNSISNRYIRIVN